LLVERLRLEGIEVRAPDPDEARPVAAVEKADVVVNVSGPRVRPGFGWADYFREHVGGAAQVARSMSVGTHLVHISSTAVYGARGGQIPAGAVEAPTRFPSAAYACAKLAAEVQVRALAADRGFCLTVLRPSMVYGPSVDSALASIRRLASRGLHLRLVPGEVRQHLLHIDLFVEAIQRAVSGPMPSTTRVLDVADPFVLTNADLIPLRRGLPVLVPVGRLLRLETLAVLGIDNVFDPAPAYAALGIDATEFARERTFDPYWRLA
jgi:nucleoside-diphosphate-sugar epimerase